MADIKEIDYDQIIVKASQIASAANEMQNAVKTAFKKIESMSDNWFGNSYDNFINVVNMSITGLNKIFEITVSDIPHEIAAKAKSYAASNQASTSSSLTEQIAVILSDLPKTNKGAKLRFRTASVQADQKQIESKFEDAKTSADKASQIADSLEGDWNSISGDSNIKELKAAFKKVNNTIEIISKALSSTITEQANTIENAENLANAIEAAQKAKEERAEQVQEFAQNLKDKIQESRDQTWKNLLGRN